MTSQLSIRLKVRKRTQVNENRGKGNMKEECLLTLDLKPFRS